MIIACILWQTGGSLQQRADSWMEEISATRRPEVRQPISVESTVSSAHGSQSNTFSQEIIHAWPDSGGNTVKSVQVPFSCFINAKSCSKHKSKIHCDISETNIRTKAQGYRKTSKFPE